MLNPRHENTLAQLLESGEWTIDLEGRIWRHSIRTGRKSGGFTLSPLETPRRCEKRLTTGYLQVRMMFDGKRITALAHRLVWRHFHGEIPAGLCINHKNGVKDDNRPENLELATYSQNMSHAHRTGLLNQNGERNHRTKLSQSQVLEIRRRREAGERLKSIAADFGISDRTASKIARGDRWASTKS